MFSKVKYNKIEGYSPTDNIDGEKLDYNLFVASQLLKTEVALTVNDKILVAGCGQGHEALALQRIFGNKVYGVDISIAKNHSVNNNVQLLRGDISKMIFNNKEFKLIYSYHVLEHVGDPDSVMKELARLLDDKGVLFIGFPNKRRIFGYLGAHVDVGIISKLRWNLNDYKYRLLGKFENKYGAHAGFTQNDFFGLARKYFSYILPVRNEYMLKKYVQHNILINSIINLKLDEYLFPSNYFICKKS